MTLCACGCRRPVKGKHGKQYFSPACRKRVSRRREALRSTRRPLPMSHFQIQNAQEGSRTPGNGKTDTNPVTLPDTKCGNSSVHCRSCGQTIPTQRGPLPCPAYCKDCVDQELTPSDNRPPWHARVYGGRRA
jgi:hypothetical protein